MFVMSKGSWSWDLAWSDLSSWTSASFCCANQQSDLQMVDAAPRTRVPFISPKLSPLQKASSGPFHDDPALVSFSEAKAFVSSKVSWLVCQSAVYGSPLVAWSISLTRAVCSMHLRRMAHTHDPGTRPRVRGPGTRPRVRVPAKNMY